MTDGPNPHRLPACLTQAKDTTEVAHAETIFTQAATSAAGYFVLGDGVVTEVAATHLNGRQELFAQEYAATGKGTQSAISAGYSAKTAYATASRLLRNVKVGARVKELQSKAAVRAEVTMESVTRQLDEDRALAHMQCQASAAVSATMSKAKLYGLISDKIDHTVTVPEIDESAEERARRDVEEAFSAPSNGARKLQ